MRNARPAANASLHRRGGGLLLAWDRSAATVAVGPASPTARSIFDGGPAHRGGVDDARHVGQRAQRHQQRGGLRRGQPQRAAHARVLGDGDGVARERQVDQVPGPVAGQPAHPQQLQVAPQLPLRDAEVGRRLRHRDAGAGQQIGHERQQPGKAVGDPACAHAASAGRITSAAHIPPPREEARRRGFTPSPRAWRRCVRRPRPPSSPAARSASAGGPSTAMSAPWPASQRATVSRLRSSSSISSPGATRVPARPHDPTEAAQPVRPPLGHPHPCRADHRRRAPLPAAHHGEAGPRRTGTDTTP